MMMRTHTFPFLTSLPHPLLLLLDHLVIEGGWQVFYEFHSRVKSVFIIIHATHDEDDDDDRILMTIYSLVWCLIN